MKIAFYNSVIIGVCSLVGASYLPRAKGPPKKYVALGDSWATGYESNSDGRTRSKHGYPQQFAQENNLQEGNGYLDLTWDSNSLADITHHISSIASDTDLVSFTGGTVDFRFAEIVNRCDLSPDPVYCKYAISASSDYISQKYSKALQDLIARIRAQTAGARIVIFGFPRVYGSPVQNCNPGGNKLDVRLKGEHDDLNQLLLQTINNALDNVAKAVNANGQNDVVILGREVDDKFYNHRYCDSQSWLNAKPQGSDPGIYWQLGYYHPNRDGHAAYKELLTQAWRK